jgi:hypothetical protein
MRRLFRAIVKAFALALGKKTLDLPLKIGYTVLTKFMRA